MYCANCGVKLADSENECPLCKTRAFHPDITRESAESAYPDNKYPNERSRFLWPQIFVIAVFLLPMLIVLLCDHQFNGGVTWSGYVVGALLAGYVIFILPTWFRNPNPVIFAPCNFVAIGLYLLYISIATEGKWFLSFAFPVLGGVGIIVVTVITLVHYVKRGLLYIFGGASVALGAFMLLVEYLTIITFDELQFIGWSLYPLITFVLLGGMLIFLGICRPAREKMERKFFI